MSAEEVLEFCKARDMGDAPMNNLDWRKSVTSARTRARRVLIWRGREAALLLFNLVHVTVSTICRISFVCAQARIETE